MQPGMVSLADKEVQRQMHSLHEFDDNPLPMPSPPEGLDDEEQYEFKLGSIIVTAKDGPPMTVPALSWVMDHLPKYKVVGLLGDWYEHYVHMPSDFMQEMVFNSLNGNLPLSMV